MGERCVDGAPPRADAIVPQCEFGPDAKPSFLLWGDSHAAAIVPAFEEAARASRQRGQLAAFSVCPPLDHVVFGVHHEKSRRACDHFTQAVMQYALAEPKIKFVVLTAYWSAYAERSDPYDMRTGARLTDELANEVYLQALESTVVRLREAGKKVAILYRLPRPPFDVPWTLSMKALLGYKLETNFKRPPLPRIDDQIAQIAARHGVIAVPLDEAICETNTCRMLDGMRTVFKDNNHLSAYGAQHYYSALLRASLFDVDGENRLWSAVSRLGKQVD